MQISYSFDSGIAGKHILILGSIHGDEVCGSMGIERIREEIIRWDISLLSGKITCIPYANFWAYQAHKRQLTHNLNRIFWQDLTWDIHDTARYIESAILESDFVLDLHSFSAGVDAFVFNDYNTVDLNTIIRAIPIEYVMTWWTDLYTGSTELDTIGFAKRNNIPGITIECGQNDNSKSEEIAYQAILSVLRSHGNIVPAIGTNPPSQTWISVDTIIRKGEWYEFTRDWKNFDPIQWGEAIGISNTTNESILSPYTGIMIMPNSSVEIWWEWYYLWKIITYP
jgi:predicted deacylase